MNLRDQFIKEYGPEVKPREGNNIRLKCPKCKKRSLSCHIGTGLINCFHCGYGRGIRFEGEPSVAPEVEIDRKLHLEVLRVIMDNSPLVPHHRKYLEERGIVNPDLYNIGSISFSLDSTLKKEFSREELIASGYYFQSSDSFFSCSALRYGRILFPHWYGTELIGAKTRIRPNVNPDLENEPKYASARGSRVGSYVWYRELSKVDLIMTEGEVSAMVATQAGFPSVGIPGLGTISSQKILNQVLSLTRDVERVFIILDSDPDMSREKYSKAQLLRKTIGSRSAILYLPQDTPEECMDLDLFISKYPSEELEELMEDAWHTREETYKKINGEAG